MYTIAFSFLLFPYFITSGVTDGWYLTSSCSRCLTHLQHQPLEWLLRCQQPRMRMEIRHRVQLLLLDLPSQKMDKVCYCLTKSQSRTGPDFIKPVSTETSKQRKVLLRSTILTSTLAAKRCQKSKVNFVQSCNWNNKKGCSNLHVWIFVHAFFVNCLIPQPSKLDLR